jgi:hypothetical protein
MLVLRIIYILILTLVYWNRSRPTGRAYRYLAVLSGFVFVAYSSFVMVRRSRKP